MHNINFCVLCLFCLVRHKSCWNCIALSLTRLVEVVTCVTGKFACNNLLLNRKETCCYRQVVCNNFTVQKTSLLKDSQAWNSQDKFKKVYRQSKPILESADPKDNVIKTSAKSQDESQDTNDNHMMSDHDQGKPQAPTVTWRCWKHLNQPITRQLRKQ